MFNTGFLYIKVYINQEIWVLDNKMMLKIGTTFICEFSLYLKFWHSLYFIGLENMKLDNNLL